MAENIIDINLLRKYDGLLKDFGSILNRSTTYTLGTVVSCKGKYLRCITAGTTGSSALNLSNVSVGDEIIDGTVTWTIFDPFSGSSGATISDWESATSYALNDLVIYSNTLYKCNTAHTSTSTFDATKWQGISVDTNQVALPDWRSDTQYILNQCVIYNGDLYRCSTSHTSSLMFDSSKWEQILGGTSTILYTGTTWNNTDTNIVTSNIVNYDFLYINYSLSDDGLTSDIDITRIFTKDDLALIDLGVKIDTTHYICLLMKKTSSTGFGIDFREFSTYEYYRINKIVGVIGGGGDSGGEGSGGDWNQVTKINVVAPLDVDINIPYTNTFKRPPVEVLKYEQGATDITTNVLNFDVGDGSKFEIDGVTATDSKLVTFDGVVKPNHDITYSLNTPTLMTNKYYSESEEIDLSDYKVVEEVSLE